MRKAREFLFLLIVAIIAILVMIEVLGPYAWLIGIGLVVIILGTAVFLVLRLLHGRRRPF